jgi:hypothetical protein
MALFTLGFSGRPCHATCHATSPVGSCLGGHSEGTYAAVSARLFAERRDCQCCGLHSCAGPES